MKKFDNTRRNIQTEAIYIQSYFVRYFVRFQTILKMTDDKTYNVHNVQDMLIKQEKIMQEKLDKLMKENEELKKRQHCPDDVYFKVNERGGVAIHGLGKYPTNLFAEQLFRLLDKIDDLHEFIEDNKEELSWRNKPN